VTSPEEMKQRLDEGGLLVGEMVVYEDFLYYKGGVYRHAWGDRIGSHAVEIEGYDDAQVCWRVKNSWGTSWGDSSGYFRMACGEAGIEDNVYEIVYTTTPTPTITPEPEPMADDYVAEGLAHFEQGCPLLREHTDCTAGIRHLQQAIEICTAVTELDQNNALAYSCRGMSRSCLEEGLNEAVQDLEHALNLGLEGDQRVQAEQELPALNAKLAAPVCVSVQAPVFGVGITEDGKLINPASEFPAGATREVSARWEIANPCNENVTYKWRWNDELNCQHPGILDETWDWTSSAFFSDEGTFELGTGCVSIWHAGEELSGSEGCFTVTEQPTPPPSSGAPEILSIEFPSQITADGTPFYGTLEFTDPEGDITGVSFDPINAIEFPSFAFNPMDYVAEGDFYRGRSNFNMYCTIVQDVTMRVTLYDASGNSSHPVDFTFGCR